MKKQRFEIKKCPHCHVDSTFRIVGEREQCMHCGKTICKEEKRELDFLDVT